MKITWLGHACFLLEQDGYRIVIDPYRDVEGYPPLQTQAHAVYCSHGHFDHSAVECVALLPERESPFTVTETATFHDEQQGALRGENTVRVFSAGGVRVAHLGDLGHLLTAEQLRSIGPVDVVLVPVGDIYTIDAAKAKAVCDSLNVPCIVPMHYYRPPYGFSNLASPEVFLELFPREAVHRLEGNSLQLEPGMAGVFLPAFAG